MPLALNPSHTPHPEMQPGILKTWAFRSIGLGMSGKMVTLHSNPCHRKTKAFFSVLFFSIDLSPPQILYILFSSYSFFYYISILFFLLPSVMQVC